LLELDLGAHIMAYLVAVLTLIISHPLEEYTFTTSAILLVSIVIPAAAFVLLDYYFTGRENTPAFNLGWNLVKHAAIFVIISGVYFSIQEERLWLFSSLFLLPVVLACINIGQKWGMVFAAGATGVVFSSSVVYTGNQLGHALETALVPGATFFLLAWFLGGIISVERQTTEKLYSLANQDSLTGLDSHRSFHERLSREIENSEKKDLSLSLVFLDLDNFKKYNENFGHTMGDRLLQEIARLLYEHSPSRAVLSRYSGDSFGIMLPGSDLEKAREFADNISKLIREHRLPEDISSPYEEITVSAGVASYPEHASTSLELLEAADEALYSSKCTGKNKVSYYHSIIEQLKKMAGEDDRELINSLRTLMTVVNGRDRYTYGHSERVAYYAKKMGEELGIASRDLQLLEIGSFLHDLGKIEAGQDVLNKKGSMMEEEWHTILQHPEMGANILKPLELLKPAIPAILHHHENYDGTGYPHGLSGKNIPLWARILRVVDSFDAMITIRPYKRIFTVSEALDELMYYKGIYYDPELVDVFADIIRKEMISV